MTSVPEQVYTDNFDKIYEWYKKNVHPGYEYSVIDLSGTFLKMIDSCSTTSNICFRVILDATYEKTVNDGFVLSKTVGDKKHFSYIPKETNYSYQKCFVVLDDNNQPVDEHLFSLAELGAEDYRLQQ